jgi:ABC-type sugar transport system ATPase subunit
VFPGGKRAFAELDLQIEDGELMVLVGPSGCGKTTTLRMVAGLEPVTDGEIRIGDRLVNSLDPGRRNVAMVFQNYSLYPHMSVFENLAFPSGPTPCPGRRSANASANRRAARPGRPAQA